MAQELISRFLLRNPNVPFADGKILVAGHTPLDEPRIGNYRIDLDTGSGILSINANVDARWVGRIRVTNASGEALSGTPGSDGMGTIAQGYLEMSNVDVVEEMVSMIMAQRAYEITSKAIQTADNMLQIANNLKR